jgi:SAM-dependent methyltransferase
MVKENNVDKYFKLVIQNGLYSKENYLKFYLNYLFNNITFNNKSMLDIGGGTGLFSFYAACMGADSVVCIEPEAVGSSPGIIEKFNRLRSSLQIEEIVKLEKSSFQEYKAYNKKFDIILLHDSINHLDEEACINLQNDKIAIESYKKIFQKLSNLSNNNAKIIITDCSRYNFFAYFNINNPFAKTIEWYKHQPPECWAKLLVDVGFFNPKIRWTTFNPLYSFGRVLLGNKFASYFIDSKFCLTIDKK